MLFDNEIPRWKGDITLSLLRTIAEHLSGRDDCKGIEYRVSVRNDRIIIDPQRNVFPNTHRRKDTDKLNVISHVMKSHFPEYFNYIDEMDETHVKSNVFVEGRYIYKLSSDRKQRRWERDEVG